VRGPAAVPVLRRGVSVSVESTTHYRHDDGREATIVVARIPWEIGHAYRVTRLTLPYHDGLSLPAITSDVLANHYPTPDAALAAAMVVVWRALGGDRG
jgi:hypothetical protein